MFPYTYNDAYVCNGQVMLNQSEYLSKGFATAAQFVSDENPLVSYPVRCRETHTDGIVFATRNENGEVIGSYVRSNCESTPTEKMSQLYRCYESEGRSGISEVVKSPKVSLEFCKNEDGKDCVKVTEAMIGVPAIEGVSAKRYDEVSTYVGPDGLQTGHSVVTSAFSDSLGAHDQLLSMYNNSDATQITNGVNDVINQYIAEKDEQTEGDIAFKTRDTRLAVAGVGPWEKFSVLPTNVSGIVVDSADVTMDAGISQ